ncbi:C-type Lectin CRL isoform X2 [Anolis carolinensis]|uniref:C-type Lectin CRL isoform X2 n=1 Tax=Anolis carolinensis TaxID=28377 RepID=UPI002F2B537D
MKTPRTKGQATKSELGLVLCFHILLLGLLATSIFLNGIEAAGCPSGWLRIQEYCYGLFSVRMSWEEAETACQSFKQNCHLASIISEQEGNIISRFILTQHNPKEGVWIGLYDSTEVGQWRWSDMSMIDYMPWAPGRPGMNRTTGACVHLAAKYDFSSWKDDQCSQKMKYLCMMTM